MNEIFNPNQREELSQLAEPKFSLGRFLKNNKIAVGTALALILALGIAALVLFNQEEEIIPVSNNVVLDIKGPAQLSSGDQAEYRIVYRNGEDADLVGIALEVFYPSGFQFKSATPAPTSSAGSRFNLPLLKSGENGEVKIKGKLSGATSEDKQIAAKLTYKLTNFNSEFEVSTSFHTIILAPSLTLDITGPIEVINGQDVTLSIVFTNVSASEFDNLVLQLTYPDGYNFLSSSPKPSKAQNYWPLPKLPVGGKGQIELVGSFAGEPNQERMIVAELGQIIGANLAPLLTASASFKIIPASLFLNVEVQPKDLVELGQVVEYHLEYGNQGDVGATNVTIALALESTILDLNRLSVFDAIVAGNTITWKSATLSQLSTVSPGQKGEITFTVPVKSNLTTNLKNQTIKTTATIKSDQMPKVVRAADLELKLASRLNLLVTGEFVSGALPMKVGQPTIFSITFLLTNLSNDLANTEVIASLPLPASAWENLIVPEAEKSNLTYDPSSGKIRWKVGELSAFVGKYTPARTVTFQLRVVPTEPDRGKTVRLLSEIKAEGLDTFTNQNVSSQEINEISTGTLDDEQLYQKGNTVQ